MPRTRDRYVEELASTVAALFASEQFDPRADEIAEAHFPGKALGGEIIEGIRKKLQRIRDVLEELDFEVYLVNRTYYLTHRHNPPPTDSAARKCIPGGYGVGSQGIRLHTEKDDRIWKAWQVQNSVSGAAKLRKSLDRTVAAAIGGRVTEPVAAELIDTARRQAEPTHPDLMTKVLEARSRDAESEEEASDSED